MDVGNMNALDTIMQGAELAVGARIAWEVAGSAWRWLYSMLEGVVAKMKPKGQSGVD